MADAAIGIAAASIAFLDFSIELGTAAKMIYNSLDGQTDADRNVMRLTEVTKNLAEKLQNSKPTMEQTPEEREIDGVAYKCEQMAKKLLLLMKNRSLEKRSMRGAVKAACKAIWSAEEEKDTLKVLQDYRNLLFMLQSTLEFNKVQKGLEQLKKSGSSHKVAVAELDRKLVLEMSMIEACSVNTRAIFDFLQLHKESEACLTKSRQDRILEGLRYSEMDHFYRTLNAHDGTLTWLVEDEKCNEGNYNDNDSGESSEEEEDADDEDDEDDEEQTDEEDHNVDENGKVEDNDTDEEFSPEQIDARSRLAAWMSEKIGVFCISGKPGAGKSTLMKFLYNHPKVQQRLREWAGEKTLCCGRFFFHKDGTSMENSLSGLFQTLLFTMLSDCPGLILIAFPKKWKSMAEVRDHSGKFSFEDAEILEGLNRLFGEKQVRKSHRFALFIDGLDEFVPPKSKPVSVLANILESWIKMGKKNIKICVSARPETYSGPFGQFKPELRVQDVTKSDMSRVAKERLSAIYHFKYLSENSTEGKKKLNGVISTIVDSSEGVFLWLGLMLTQLEDGLFSECTAAELIKSIEAYPREMDPFFREILKRINSGEKGYVHRALEFVALATDGFLRVDSLQVWAFDNYEQERFPSAPAQRFLEITHKKFKGKFDEDVECAQRRFTRRCKGLLEAEPQFAPVYEFKAASSFKFTHRTLNDFIYGERKLWGEYLLGFDWFQPYCYSYFALASYTTGECFREYMNHRRDYSTLDRLVELYTSENVVIPRWFLEFLQKLDEHANAECDAIMGGPSQCPRLITGEDEAVPKNWEFGTDACREFGHFSVDFLVLENGLHEYLQDHYRRQDGVRRDRPRRAAAAVCTIHRMLWLNSEDTVHRALLARYKESLKVILQDGNWPLLESNIDYPSFEYLHSALRNYHGAYQFWTKEILGTPWMVIMAMLSPNSPPVVEAILDLVIGDLNFTISCQCYLVASTVYRFIVKNERQLTFTLCWYEQDGMYTFPCLYITDGLEDIMSSLAMLGCESYETKTGHRIISVHDLPQWKNLRLKATTKSRLASLIDGSSTREYTPVGKLDIDSLVSYKCFFVAEENGILHLTQVFRGVEGGELLAGQIWEGAGKLLNPPFLLREI